MDQDKLNAALHEGEASEVVEIPAEVVEEKFTVGGKEYTQSQLDRLVNLGSIAEEAETKYNTKIDKVWPEYTKDRNELKRLKQLEQEYESVKAKQAQANIDPNDEQAKREAIAAAKNLGILTKDDLAELGIVTKDSINEYFQQQKAADRLLDQATSLEKEIDGKDGRPAFRTQEILEYMAENGIQNVNTAYKLKYETELDSWKEKQLNAAKKPGLVTQTVPGGQKTPQTVIPNKDNLMQLISEELNRGQ